MADAPLDPLLGQRVVAILETGPRTASYKLATLPALIDHCVENLPDPLGPTQQVIDNDAPATFVADSRLVGTP